jgi:peptidoglycan/LPS O-acetylase OafA/YrhL
LTAPHQATQSTTKKPVSHIGALDGLRGLAVLFVLMFHFSWSFPDRTPLLAAVRDHLWGGWFGVDLFFALSGYLITRGLVKPSAHSVGKRLKLFWARRVFRIFPLYYIVVILGTLVCLAIGARAHIPGLSYWLYYQNYSLAFDHDPLRWTAHFWSLAIEEQFYFVWPVFVLMAGKRMRIGAAIGLFGLCVVLRTGLMLGLPKLHLEGWDADQIAKFVYRATPTHMDGLLLPQNTRLGRPRYRPLAARIGDQNQRLWDVR